MGEALDAYTLGAAHAAGCESELGTLAPGKIASLTVLTHDVQEHPGALGDCAVAATIVRGQPVFDGGAA